MLPPELVPSHSGRSTAIKYCGITSLTDALRAIDAGADWIGLNFHPVSPRAINLEAAIELVRGVRSRASWIGVFVDQNESEIREIARRVGLDAAQIHHADPIDSDQLGGLPWIRVTRLANLSDLEQFDFIRARDQGLPRPPCGWLVDAQVTGLPGGTGALIDEEVLLGLAQRSVDRLILAGGLKPSNVAQRIKLARPWMVDVASGIESSPGVKCPELMRAFARAVESVRLEPADGVP